jgi:ribosome-associated protein
MIKIYPSIFLDEAELHFDFVHSSGPGGQNVNKVATAVQLRFDVLHSLPYRSRCESGWCRSRAIA